MENTEKTEFKNQSTFNRSVEKRSNDQKYVLIRINSAKDEMKVAKKRWKDQNYVIIRQKKSRTHKKGG